MEFLQNIDSYLFMMIHKTMANPFSDFFFSEITDFHHKSWVMPIAIPILLLLWIAKRKFLAFNQILCLMIAIGFSDIICAEVIKPVFARPRPIHAGLEVNIKSKSGSSSYGFPSNHAANIFAAATMLSSFFVNYSMLFYFIAFLVSFSHIYLGVHFPSDVLAGAIIGYYIAKGVLKVNALLMIRMTSIPKSKKITLKQRMEKLRRSQK